MPGFYKDGEYDLAGFAVGSVKQSAVVDGAKAAAGDVVLGLASTGVHSNGFSLVRKVLEVGPNMPSGVGAASGWALFERL